jgi:WD repeat-containing protein 23
MKKMGTKTMQTPKMAVNAPCKPTRRRHLIISFLDEHFIEIEVEEEPRNENETEDERSGLCILFLILQVLLLTLGFTAIRHRRQVLRLLANSELGRLFFTTARIDDLDDGDDDADFHPLWARRRRRQRPDPDRFPKVPSDVGRKLMISGTFGVDDIRTACTDERTRTGKKKKLAMRILQRELAQDNHSRQKLNQKLMAQVI